MLVDDVEHPTSSIFVRASDRNTLSISNVKNPTWIWHKPIPKDYDNTLPCNNQPKCIQQIFYRDIHLNQIDLKSSFVLQDVFKSEGTYLISVFDGSHAVANLTVSIRKNDSYTGYLSELIGVPFVLYPMVLPTGVHQTDARLGADCVATVIYGQRRSGRKFPYVAPTALYRFMNVKTKQARFPSPKPVKVVEGDVLHFGVHTAVLYQDNSPIGVLNDSDILIHSYHDFVETKPWSKFPYRDSTFDVLEWPNGEGSRL